MNAGSIKQILVFIIFSVLMLLLAFFIFTVARRKSEYRNKLLLSMISGLLVIPCYTVFVFSSVREVSYVARCFYYILNVWLTFFFFWFSIDYGEFKKYTKIKKIIKILIAVTVIDSLIMVVNIFTHNLFDIICRYSSYFECFCWTYARKIPILLHEIITYSYIIGGSVIIASEGIRVPYFYKKRFFGVLLGYLLVIVVHLLCELFRLTLDISILLYALMGSFVSYFASYSAPHQIISKSLLHFNDTINDVIVYFDDKGKCIFANRQAHMFFRKNGRFDESLVEQYRKSLIKCHSISPTGRIDYKEPFLLNGALREISGEYDEVMIQGNVLGSYIRFHDNTEDVNRYRQQKYQATHDALTGIYNSERFFQRVDEIMEEDPDTPRIMLCSNIVDFKLINEILGTKFGDEILMKQAQLLGRMARADDVYCRIGDDKFAFFLRSALFEPRIFEEGFKVLQKLTESESFQLKNEVGVYEVRQKGESARIMYDKALMAIEHKTDNSKTFSFYNEEFMERQLIERNFTSHFEDSLNSGLFQLRFDPFMNQKKELVGFEACSSWNHPESGLLSCEIYDKILENNGLLYKLNEFIWEKAIEQFSILEEKGVKNLKLILKIASSDLFYINILEKIKELLAKYKFSSENLVLEFYEETISQDYKNVNAIFAAFQEMGIKIIINEFGNGYSSLNLIKDTHCDGIKIASNFMQETDSLNRTEKILEFILQLTNVLGVKTHAYGIDSEEQFQKIKELNISSYQGKINGETLTVNQLMEKYNLA